METSRKNAMLALMLLSVSGCSFFMPGSDYSVKTPSGLEASARSSSNSDSVELEYSVNPDTGATTVKFKKVGTDNSTALQKAQDAVQQLADQLKSLYGG